MRRKRLVSIAALAALVAVLIVASLAWWLPLPERLGTPPSTVVEYRDGSPAFVFLAPDDRYRMAVRPELHRQIDGEYLEALLRFEDKRFASHPGVDPLAVLRSMWVNLRHGRAMTGASTLTLQLARVLEPRPRTLRSKLLEAARAFQLEARLSKSEILAAYLTFIPFGRNVEGVVAASWSYFGHGPEELSPAEIATLLAVPQSPASRYPRPGRGEILSAARDGVARWLIEHDKLLPPSEPGDADEGRGLTADVLLRQIQATQVPERMRPLPREAAHFAFWLRSRHPDELRLATTLDRGLQRIAERRMAEAHHEMTAIGIHNGAAVVVDHRSAEVRALVGNFDFWDQDHGGQIAGFDVARSPGSALKPFLYALAIDRALALPEHLVLDVPVHYTDYSPNNYDGDFVGLISLEEALSHSLNVPFVRLLGEIGVERFIEELKSVGVSTLRSEPGYYGLSAAIGSVEITPLEVAGLYTALASGGAARELQWLRHEPGLAGGDLSAPAISGRDRSGRDPSAQWLSQGSSYLTRRALERKDRPDFPERRRLSGAPPKIHWKTGTSYGHRDAWAAGSGPDATAVVWLGNFDQSPAYDLVGSEAAGPLLFDLLEAVEDRNQSTVRHLASSYLSTSAFPRDLKTVEVCAYSGHLPSPECTDRRPALAVRDSVPAALCPYHVAVDLDLDSGLALNPSCRAGRRWERRVYRTVPRRLARHLERQNKWSQTLPALDPTCRPSGQVERLAFLSPPAGHVQVLIPGLPASEQEVPFEVETGATGALSWFVDGLFAGVTQPGERFWWSPKPGEHEVLAISESGASVERRIVVRTTAMTGSPAG